MFKKLKDIVIKNIKEVNVKEMSKDSLKSGLEVGTGVANGFINGVLIKISVAIIGVISIVTVFIYSISSLFN